MLISRILCSQSRDASSTAVAINSIESNSIKQFDNIDTFCGDALLHFFRFHVDAATKSSMSLDFNPALSINGHLSL